MHREPKLVEQDHELSAEQVYTLSWLLDRIWHTITHAWTKERISRGEYILSFTMIQLIQLIVLSIVLIINTAVWGVATEQTIDIIDLTISVACIVRYTGLTLRRVHDFGRSDKRVYIPYAMMILGFMLATLFTDSSMYGWTLIQFIGGVFLVVGCVRCAFLGLFCFFKKGIAGENRYGADPLVQQPKNNRLYRQLYAMCLLFAILGGVLVGGIRGTIG